MAAGSARVVLLSGCRNLRPSHGTFLSGTAPLLFVPTLCKPPTELIMCGYGRRLHGLAK